MPDTTRRQVMAAATIGAAMTAASTATAAVQDMPMAQARGGKQDPRSKYPKPHSNRNRNPGRGWPSQMNHAPTTAKTAMSDRAGCAGARR